MELSSSVRDQELLYNSLLNLGSFYGLDIWFDNGLFLKESQVFHNGWKKYNPRKSHIPRYGLSLTSVDGSLSGIPDLDSLREYNAENGTNHSEATIRTPTLALEGLSSIRQPISPFLPHLARSHLLRLDDGGYFPFHRDSQDIGAECFRLIALLHNCSPCGFCFVYDRQLIHLESGQLYFMNTKKEHALFSFSNNATLLVLNVLLNPASVKLVIQNLHSK